MREKGDAEFPFFMLKSERFTPNFVEMKISEIIDAVGPAVVARKCFIVEINVSGDNDVEIVIESEDSNVVLDDCVEISRRFEECFDRAVEDYSLTVTSAGLDQPFKVLKQYRKAVGTQVETALKGGRKFVAELVDADESSVTLKYSLREAVEGKKKKELVEHCDRFGYDDVNYVRPHIDFK